jgi:hypothetical protein
VNRRGHRQTLVAAHPGNRNAQKAGVCSKRALAERADQLETEVSELSPKQLQKAVLADELRSLLALKEALDQAIADDGVRTRDGQPRALVDQRLRVHDKLVRLTGELGRFDDSGEEAPPISPLPNAEAGSLCETIAHAHHERQISDILPGDISADLYLRAIIATQDPNVSLKQRALARRLLTKRTKDRPWQCVCFEPRTARDDLELREWIEEARGAGVRPNKFDANLAAIVRKAAAGQRPPDWNRYRFRYDAVNYVILDQAQRLNDLEGSRARRTTQEEDPAVAPFWQALLSEGTSVEDRLSVFTALDDLRAFGTCECGKPERVFSEQEFDQKCGYVIRLLPLRNHRAALLRVQFPESFLALQAAIDDRALGWSADSAA